MTIGEFIGEFGGLIALAVLVIGYFVVRVINYKKKKREKEVKERREPVTNFDDLPFNQTASLLESLRSQRKKAEEEIGVILEEGKILAKEQQDLKEYYHEQDTTMAMKVQQLGMRNSTWRQQLASLEKMIASQEEMEERLGK